MRYSELTESRYNPSMDNSVPHRTDGRKPEITLGLLNRLKHLRKSQIREKQLKELFLPLLYGDNESSMELQQQNLEVEQMNLDQEKLKNERLKLENEATELSRENSQREKIQVMALRTLKKPQP